MSWKSCRLKGPNKVSKQIAVRDKISEDIFISLRCDDYNLKQFNQNIRIPYSFFSINLRAFFQMIILNGRYIFLHGAEKFISPHFLMQPATHPQFPKETGLFPPLPRRPTS
jgi:hypothetical protein